MAQPPLMPLIMNRACQEQVVYAWSLEPSNSESTPFCRFLASQSLQTRQRCWQEATGPHIMYHSIQRSTGMPSIVLLQ